MDCEQVESVSGENLQQGVKLRRTLKPDARLNRKRPLHRAAQNAEEFVHPGQIPEKPAASTFAINNRGGTAKVEIDRRDGVLFQSLRHAGHRHEVVADDLRYRWSVKYKSAPPWRAINRQNGQSVMSCIGASERTGRTLWNNCANATRRPFKSST
jgi:hypothetical protein